MPRNKRRLAGSRLRLKQQKTVSAYLCVNIPEKRMDGKLSYIIIQKSHPEKQASRRRANKAKITYASMLDKSNITARMNKIFKEERR